jgi:hypothetical protein
MPNVDCLRFSTTTTEARSVRYNTPIRLETVTDFRFDPYNLTRDIRNDELVPPQDREEFMDWYLARRCESSGSMSSREVQAALRDAEEVWRFVSRVPEPDPDDLAERAARAQLWSRTYINSLARRKGNAVLAVTIRC